MVQFRDGTKLKKKKKKTVHRPLEAMTPGGGGAPPLQCQEFNRGEIFVLGMGDYFP